MTASLPTFLKTWDFAYLNQRYSFVSLNDATASVLYNTKVRLLANGGTVVYTCDGTTGPSSSSDHTDRWSSKANCTTRGANAASAQSFAVISYAGVHVLLTYQGASDDICRFAFSQGSLYTPAGTANQQPTATDETKWSEAVTVVGATASADRLHSVLCSTDGTIMRQCIFRQGTMIDWVSIERISEAPGITTGTVVAANNGTSATYQSPTGQGGALGTSASAGAAGCMTARVASTNVTAPGGGVLFNNSASPFSANPELNGGALVFPLFFCSTASNNTGVLGTRLDAYYALTNASQVNGFTYDDIAQSERLMVVGPILQPWSSTTGLTTS